MALICYVGDPRAGKSYEVVTNVILPSIRSGRNVISNIAGLNEDVMHAFLVERGSKKEDLGRLTVVTAEHVMQPKFFRTDYMDSPEDAFVQPGDLVALDEIWRFWPLDKKIPEDHMNFFRMHGHFVNPKNGLTCEIALVTQDIGDVHRRIKGIVNQTYVMTKNTALGSDKSYQVAVYHKTNIRRKPINLYSPLVYKAEFFPLYKTHSKAGEGVQGQEKRIDKRGSLFAGKFFKVVMPMAVVMLIGGAFGVYRFFTQGQVTTPSQAATPTEGQQQAAKGIPAAGNVNQQAANNSTEWRVAGQVTIGGINKVLLVHPDGRSRYLIPAALASFGTDIKTTVHDKEYTSWDVAQKSLFQP